MKVSTKVPEGHPDPVTPQQTDPKDTRSNARCMFQKLKCAYSHCALCSFCKADNEPLHQVLTHKMGANLFSVKANTLDDEVRVCCTDLEDPGDAIVCV